MVFFPTFTFSLIHLTLKGFVEAYLSCESIQQHRLAMTFVSHIIYFEYYFWLQSTIFISILPFVCQCYVKKNTNSHQTFPLQYVHLRLTRLQPIKCVKFTPCVKDRKRELIFWCDFINWVLRWIRQQSSDNWSLHNLI